MSCILVKSSAKIEHFPPHYLELQRAILSGAHAAVLKRNTASLNKLNGAAGGEVSLFWSFWEQ